MILTTEGWIGYSIFYSTILIFTALSTSVRPGPEEGHEVDQRPGASLL